MISTQEKVAVAGTATTSDEASDVLDPLSIIAPLRLLEMTPSMSRERIALTPGIDFEGVRDEERERQRQLTALRAWSSRVLGRRVMTQEDRRRFRMKYALVLAAGEAA